MTQGAVVKASLVVSVWFGFAFDLMLLISFLGIGEREVKVKSGIFFLSFRTLGWGLA